MSNIIQESSQIGAAEGDHITPLTESAILDYINSESDNTKNLKNQLEFLGETQSYKDGKLYVQEGKDILVVYLEDYIRKDIDDYLINL